MPIKRRKFKQLRWLSALLTAACLLSAEAHAQILYSDNFEDGTLAPWTTTNAARSGVSNAPGCPGGGTFGAFTRNNTVTLTSPSFNAAVPSARLDIYIRRGADAFSEDTDPGEDFVLEYQRADSSWVPLRTYLGSGINGQIYNDTFILPADALHGALALRVRQTGGSGFDWDYWHFDDVVVTQIPPPPPLGVGGCDDFESGLFPNWTINATSGFAGVNGLTSQSPTNALSLNGGTVNVTSLVVDTSNPQFGDLTMWIRRGADAFSEDPDAGENLVVEYLNDIGAWVALETFTGAGLQGQIFPRTYTLPAAGRHAAFQLRFRMTGGSGAPWDYWHVDDVCFDLALLPLLQVTKVAQTIFDPENTATNPKAIPGGIVEYTIGVTNQGPGTVDNDSLEITDVVPANTDLLVGPLTGPPAISPAMDFIDGPTPSGLTLPNPIQ